MAQGIDFGIADRTAIVCGSSKGLGRACARALAQAGAEVVLNGRSQASLTEAADELSQISGRRVRAVVADVSTAQGREDLLAACQQPDILINNAAGPPPGNFEEWDEAAWLSALRANMVAPILMAKAVLGPMRARKWGRIINITSSAVKAPLPLLGLSNGARSGLTGFIAGLAREVAADGVTINNLLPGSFDTDRLRSYAVSIAKSKAIDADQAWQGLADANPAGRIGRPDEFGMTCAFLASEHAGYINGQSILLDGGAYPGVF
jgi:3-oxoacyl-[acyl-carrier protein] reductase